MVVVLRGDTGRSEMSDRTLYALTAGCFAITLTALAMLWLG
jgi:hypothetical protein